MTSLIIVKAALSWCTADLGDGGKRCGSVTSSPLTRSQFLEQGSHMGIRDCSTCIIYQKGLALQERIFIL